MSPDASTMTPGNRGVYARRVRALGSAKSPPVCSCRSLCGTLMESTYVVAIAAARARSVLGLPPHM